MSIVANRIGILGDSHTAFFSVEGGSASFDWRKQLPACDLVCVPAATAKGFARAKAGTVSTNGFAEILTKSSSYDFMIFNLGQVDVEVGVYFRKFIKNLSLTFEDDLSLSYEAYIKKVVSISQGAGFQPVVKLPNPTALRNDLHARKYIMRHISGSFKKHVVLNWLKKDGVTLRSHGLLNEKASRILKRIANDYGVSVLDLRRFFENPNTPGCVAQTFLAPKPDVHMSYSPVVYDVHLQALADQISR